MERPADKVFALLKNAKTPGDFFSALTQDKLLFVGILVTIGFIYLFGRIYIWPQINPFQFQGVSTFWDWVTTPRTPTIRKDYPYAKVIYPF